MTALDYILNGLTAELELERELGVRFVELDRALLKPVEAVKKAPVAEPPKALGEPEPKPVEIPAPQKAPEKTVSYGVVFLHAGALQSVKSLDLMEKARGGLGLTEKSAPLITENPVPEAKAYVVMGREARTLFGASLQGHKAYFAGSPDDMTRFVGAEAQAMKRTLWAAMKSAHSIAYPKE